MNQAINTEPSRDIEDLAPGEAMFVDWTSDEYYADRRTTSNSELGWLINDGPAVYKARRDGRLKTKPTKSMVLGTLLHMRVLEPDVWKSRLAEPKPFKPHNAKGNAKKGPERDAYEQWKAECDDWEAKRKPTDIVLDDDQSERLLGMINGIGLPGSGLKSHPDANDWLMEWEGEAERPIVWRHPESGVLVRMKPDRIIEADDNTILVPDLKSTDDPNEQSFERSIKKHGYHRQAALYTDGIQALFPGARVLFVLVVVRNKGIYEAATYQPIPEALSAGRRQYTKALLEVARRFNDDDWLADWQKGCRMIGKPHQFVEYEDA